jgi:asparagine synthase (glutamine-hydrolysing)
MVDKMIRPIPCAIALSFSPAAALPLRAEIMQRAAGAISALDGGRVAHLNLGEDVAILTNYPEERVARHDADWLLMPSATALTTNGRLVDAKFLLREHLRGGTAGFDGLEPPFLAILGSSYEVAGLSDAVGLGHLFLFQGKDCAALGTSASPLAKTFQCEFDPLGLFQQMMIGHRLLDTTAFKNIKLVPPGAKAVLARGEYRLDWKNVESSRLCEDPTKEGKNAIVAAVDRCLTADPNCAIELSGGLDSRMILAAIPKELRSGRTAYTIGYPDSPDIATARVLATSSTMDHQIIDLSQYNGESTDAVWQRARRVAHRDDFATNIFDRLVIDCVDDNLLGQARIGGVNGELARGFYYAGFPTKKPLTKDIVKRLLSWRLTTNDAAPSELFDATIVSNCRLALFNAVEEALEQGDFASLGNRLDHFYLRQRMRHWAGSAITRAQSNRSIFVPFFHSDYTSWAMGLPVPGKKDSISFCRVLEFVDPNLASIPLDSTLLPATIAKGGIFTLIALAKIKQQKIRTKLYQRLAGKRRMNLGSAHFHDKLCRKEIVDILDWSKIYSTGLFDENALERLRLGIIPWGRTSLAYMICLHFQLEYLESKNCAANDLLPQL